MTTAYTSYLGLALPVTGELSGTWGDTVNNYITQYLDASVAGTNTFSSDSDVTLVKTTNASLTGTSSQYAVLLWTAGGTATRTIIAPSASSGGRQFYIVINKTSSTQSIKLCGAGPTTGVTITANNSAICAWNGSDFIQVAGLVNLATNVTGTLPVANGGTGAATLTADNVLLGNGTSALQAVAPGTVGNVLTSNGTTWTSAAAMPVGSFLWHTASTVPTSYLEANGAAISRSTYASLFAVIGTTYGAGNGTTTFNVPDVRGYFVRGYDNGRGVDTSRVFGSNQVATHVGVIGDSRTTQQQEAQTQGDSVTVSPAETYFIMSGYQNTSGSTTGPGNFVGARPINIAFLPCIKYQ
jgi:microcystin-dependent protein